MVAFDVTNGPESVPRLRRVPTTRQHVVSQVLLRQWEVDESVTAVKFRDGQTSAKSPRAEGFVP